MTASDTIGIIIMLSVLCVMKNNSRLMINGLANGYGAGGQRVGGWMGRGTQNGQETVFFFYTSSSSSGTLGMEKKGLSGFSLGRRRSVHTRLARFAIEKEPIRP
jgi:hypothetical protein